MRTRGRHQRRRTRCSARAPTSSCWASSSHAWKVNFCKFTNETRNGLEDSSQHSGPEVPGRGQRRLRRRRLRAGAGLRRDHAGRRPLSAVSLPEVPLLGVLPGTGGLTRVTDKRKVRHDLADIFCTTTEGVRGQKAKDWRLVDDIAKPAAVRAARCRSARCELAARQRPPGRRARASTLTPLQRTIEADALRYSHVDGRDRPRQAHRDLHGEGARGAQPSRHRRDRSRRRRLVPAGAGARAGRRDPVDAHQRARHRHLADQDRRRRRGGAGDGRDAAAAPGPLARARDHRPAAPHLQPPRRVVAQPVRADRAGLVLRRHACSSWRWPATAATSWRCPTTPRRAPKITVGEANFGLYPMVTGQSRLRPPLLRRGSRRSTPCAPQVGQPLDADAASRSAWSPATPTTSTGPTRCASRSRSASR